MILEQTKILIIYTGGTIGMIEKPESGVLEPFNFEHLEYNVPEIKKLNFSIDVHVFDPPIDSSDIDPSLWIDIVKIIENNYSKYDGFVVLHGTDTMSYTASALSFMIDNLKKPIVLTGSQLPIGKLRTDGKENLITALEIAADKDSKGNPTVPEVSVYLQNLLMRGNRTTKTSSYNFSAFDSPNCEYLAEVGIEIKYNKNIIIQPNYDKNTTFNYSLDNNIIIIKLFPGISQEIFEYILQNTSIKGIILETFGSGNAPSQKWFIDILKKAINRGIFIINVTQCNYGSVEMFRYETGIHLEEIGVISGSDMTTEAAVTKLMKLLGQKENIKSLINKPIRGEFNIS